MIEEFFVEIVATFFGVAGAFYLDRRIRASNQKEKARAILSSLKEEINHNIDLLRQIQVALKPTTVIFYNLDKNVWSAISLSEFVGVISKGIMDRIFRLYYEYEHFNRKIDMQFHMTYGAFSVSTGYMKGRKALVDAIQVLIPPWEKESEQLIKDIDSEIKRLS